MAMAMLATISISKSLGITAIDIAIVTWLSIASANHIQLVAS